MLGLYLTLFSHIFYQLLVRVLELNCCQEIFLGDPNLAWIGIVIVAVWQGIAFNTILYLAGLVTISEDLYEAASIDGAGCMA